MDAPAWTASAAVEQLRVSECNCFNRLWNCRATLAAPDALTGMASRTGSMSEATPRPTRFHGAVAAACALRALAGSVEPESPDSFRERVRTFPMDQHCTHVTWPTNKDIWI